MDREMLALAPITTQQALVLRLTGDLDHEAAARTLLDVSDALPPPSLIVLDLQGLDLITAVGARMLAAFAQASRARGMRCHLLYTPDTAVARVLELAGLDLPMYVELAAALAEDAPAEQSSTLDSDELLRQLESLTRNLLDTTTVGAALRRIVDAARVVVAGADLVSVTLRASDGTLFTPAATGEAGGELDRVQYEAKEGPCYDAADPDGPAYATSDDLAAETRWPRFCAAATGHGYHAILSTELIRVSGQSSGALNIYSGEPHGFTESDRHASLLLATHASLALAHTHATELAGLNQANLRRAIDSRDVIGQAKGILMNRQGISAEEAFDLLRRTSQHLNVKIIDLARTLTAHHDELDRP